MSKTIVAIHGVGHLKPGALLNSVVAGIPKKGVLSYADSAIDIDGHIYRGKEFANHLTVDSVIEINWDDLSPRPTGPVSAISRFIHVLSAMLRLSTLDESGQDNKPKAKLLFSTAYRFVLLTIAFWSAFLPIAAIGLFLDGNRVASFLWPICVGLFALGLWVVVRRFAREFRFAWLWSAPIMSLGAFSFLSGVDEIDLLEKATFIYSASQVLTSCLLFLALCELLITSRHYPRFILLTRLCSLYLPFALMSGLAALVWVSFLYISSQIDADGFIVFEGLYRGAVIYELDLTEFLLMSSVFLTLLALLLPAASQVLFGRSGSSVHAGLKLGLLLSPIFVLSSFFLFWTISHGSFPVVDSAIRSIGETVYMAMPWSSATTDLGVLGIYSVSAVRLLPLLLYLSPAIRNVIDITSDVVLYLDPDPGNRLRPSVRQRVGSLLEYLSQQGKDVVILAHSQGTPIVCDVLATTEKSVSLVTMGSPIESLYRFFIGKDAVSLPTRPQWLNLHRTGDFISCQKDIDFEQGHLTNVSDLLGGHTGYFSDPLTYVPLKQRGFV